MRFAYADPPYPGQARLYAKEAKSHGRTAREENHALLIAHLVEEYPDGWALSTSASALPYVCRLLPEGKVRVLSWHKPFVPAYRGIRPVYSWEPIIMMGGRPPEFENAPLTRDCLVMGPRMGLRPRQTNAPTGAKPPAFCRWLLDCLNFQPGDEMDDIFPGSGVMGDVVANYQLRFLEEFSA